MKHLLAAATFAALFSAMPASAQTAYGYPVGPLVWVDDGPDVYWKDNFAIYSTTNAVAPGASTGSALATGGVAVDAWLANPVLSGNDSAAFVLPTNAVDPVPEPATWAMMLVGFAAVGGALRRRHKASLGYT